MAVCVWIAIIIINYRNYRVLTADLLFFVLAIKVTFIFAAPVKNVVYDVPNERLSLELNSALQV